MLFGLDDHGRGTTVIGCPTRWHACCCRRIRGNF